MKMLSSALRSVASAARRLAGTHPMPIWQMVVTLRLTKWQARPTLRRSPRSRLPRPSRRLQMTRLRRFRPRSLSSSGVTSICVCRPSSTTIASVRCARRWIWCRAAAPDVLKSMLSVLDDVQRAVAASEKSEDIAALREGERLVAQKFEETLRQKGVVEIEAVGEEFNPDFHEAVARFKAGDEKKGKVIDVIQRGYMTRRQGFALRQGGRGRVVGDECACKTICGSV